MTLGAFRTFADPLPDALLLVRCDGGEIVDGNRAALRMLGLAREELVGRRLPALAKDDPDDLRHYFRLISRSREPLPGALTLRGASGRSITCRVDGCALADPAKGIMLLRLRPQTAAHTDFRLLTEKIADLTREINRRRRAEEHQKLLINELNHRVKNTLATVQSIAAQTFRGGIVDDKACGAFEARLFALAQAHNLLTRENWESVELRDLAVQVLEPFRDRLGTAARIAIAGDDIRLPPSMALALSMAFHELATNAVKYGALSNDVGQVSLTWQVEPAPHGNRLRLHWQERGGPIVEPPRRKGFGSRLIERGLAYELGGTARLDHEPAGVNCVIDISVPSSRHST